MSSIVNITPDQAAALLLLLQSITSKANPLPDRVATLHNSSESSTASSSYDLLDSEYYKDRCRKNEENDYGLEELLAKKKKNSKSTEAQKF